MLNYAKAKSKGEEQSDNNNYLIKQLYSDKFDYDIEAKSLSDRVFDVDLYPERAKLSKTLYDYILKNNNLTEKDITNKIKALYMMNFSKDEVSLYYDDIYASNEVKSFLSICKETNFYKKLSDSNKKNKTVNNIYLCGGCLLVIYIIIMFFIYKNHYALRITNYDDITKLKSVGNFASGAIHYMLIYAFLYYLLPMNLKHLCRKSLLDLSIVFYIINFVSLIFYVVIWKFGFTIFLLLIAPSIISTLFFILSLLFGKKK